MAEYSAAAGSKEVQSASAAILSSGAENFKEVQSTSAAILSSGAENLTSIRFVTNLPEKVRCLYQEPNSLCLYAGHDDQVTEVDDTRDYRGSTSSRATQCIVAHALDSQLHSLFTYRSQLFCSTVQNPEGSEGRQGRNSGVHCIDTSPQTTKNAKRVARYLGFARGSQFEHANQLYFITHRGDLYHINVEKDEDNAQTGIIMWENSVTPNHRRMGWPSSIVRAPDGAYWFIAGSSGGYGLRRLDLTAAPEKQVVGWFAEKFVRSQDLALLHGKLYTLSWHGGAYSESETVVYEHDVLTLSPEDLEDVVRRPIPVLLQDKLGTRPVDMIVHDNLLIVANENGDIYGVDPRAPPAQRKRLLVTNSQLGRRAWAAMCSGISAFDTQQLKYVVAESVRDYLVADVVTIVQQYVGVVSLLYLTNDTGNLYACQL